MRNIRLLIEYEGTEYSGWQFQTNGVSIQETIEKALEKITKEKISLKGASRTDAGVHALGQVANFKTSSKAPLKAFKEGLNSILPGDIIIRDSQDVGPDFDPIKCAVKKSYRYCIQEGSDISVITRKYSWNIEKKLEWDIMKKACLELVGRHDFIAFRGAKAETKTTERDLMSIDFRKGPFGLKFMDFTADGFLKYMVRNIVGTLVQIGIGKMPATRIREILRSGDRRLAGPTAPPHGLFLLKVYYP